MLGLWPLGLSRGACGGDQSSAGRQEKTREEAETEETKCGQEHGELLLASVGFQGRQLYWVTGNSDS